MSGKLPDKGWACVCGCLHNFSTRTTCRWCGRKCPSVSKKKHPWPPWWNWNGGYRGKDEEAGGQEGAGGGEQPSRCVTPIHVLQDKIQKYVNMPRDEGEEQKLKELKEQLKAEHRKVEESKPASAQLQRLENHVKKTKERYDSADKKVDSARDKVKKAQEELANFEEERNECQRDHIEALQSPHEHTATLQSKSETAAMDVQGQGHAPTFKEFMDKLPDFVGEDAFADLQERIKAAAEQRRQALVQAEQEQAAQRAETRKAQEISGSGSRQAEEPPSRRSRRDQPEEEDQKDGGDSPRRSRSRSQSRAVKIYLKAIVDWEKRSPQLHGGGEQDTVAWLAERPTIPATYMEDDPCL